MFGGNVKKRALLVFVFVTQIIGSVYAQETQKLDEHCTINILNRTIQVRPDVGWALPNIPAKSLFLPHSPLYLQAPQPWITPG